MKKLTLIRHAKSSWKLDLPDHLRPLNPRGLKDAEALSKYFLEYQIQPELVYSSNAVRAQTTCDIFIKNLKINTEICQFTHELYDFSGEHLTHFIKNCPDTVNSLMVFGHNDAITNFVNTYGSLFIKNVPTCGIVTITFKDASWKTIAKGQTIHKIFPKEI